MVWTFVGNMPSSLLRLLLPTHPLLAAGARLAARAIHAARGKNGWALSP
jgi:hypothetical protein